MGAAPFPYDLVSYPTGAFAESHPRRLATLAALFGLQAPALAAARVLELGCGRGGNLIPMAYGMPGATLVGIDLAQNEIAAATARAASLGLGNLSFHHRDLCTIGDELGRFDYIIAHGVYSWVPPAVQERLLALCQSLLSEQGVAYVSYNAMPGGLIRQTLRDLIVYDGRNQPDPQLRLQRARSLSRFAAEAMGGLDPLYRSILTAERDRIAELSDPILFHDDLSDCNESLYLHQFVERAERHQLRYLADACFDSMHSQKLPPATQRLLQQLPDRVEAEQYLDFFTRRRFRRSLLCRSSVELAATPQSAAVQAMAAVSYARVELPSTNGQALAPSPVPPGEAERLALLRDEQPVRFRNLEGVVVGLGDPLAKAALFSLALASSAGLPFAELLATVRQQLSAAGLSPPPLTAEGDPLAAELAELLLTLYSGDMVELYRDLPSLTAQPGPRPRLSRLARTQLVQGPHLVNLWHRNLKIDDALGLRVLPLLDGERDRPAILAALASQPEQPPVDGPALEVALQRIAQLGLLEAP